jgi:hypothetical protein
MSLMLDRLSVVAGSFPGWIGDARWLGWAIGRWLGRWIVLVWSPGRALVAVEGVSGLGWTWIPGRWGGWVTRSLCSGAWPRTPPGLSLRAPPGLSLRVLAGLSLRVLAGLWFRVLAGLSLRVSPGG